MFSEVCANVYEDIRETTAAGIWGEAGPAVSHFAVSRSLAVLADEC